MRFSNILFRFLSLVLGIGENQNFPPPLSAAEERALFAKMKEGSRAARDRIIEHNLRLVAHIIKKYYSSSHDQDDLISIGTIGLIKAINTFDYTKGVRLATYAARCVENEILMYFRANRKTAQDVSITEPIETDKEGHSLTLMDVITQEDTILEDLDLKINSTKLYRYMEETLGEREKEIIQWRYGLITDPLTQREVAKKLGISRSYVLRRDYCKRSDNRL